MDEHFKTKDFEEISVCLDGKLSFDFTREGKVCWFRFTPWDTAEKLVGNYRNGSLSMSVKEFVNAQNWARDMIFQRGAR